MENPMIERKLCGPLFPVSELCIRISELWDMFKGALYLNAGQEIRGRLSSTGSQYGTIFVDEIGDMSLSGHRQKFLFFFFPVV